MEKRPPHIELTANQTRSEELTEAKIVRIQSLSPTVKGYSLSLDGTQSVNAKAGQWIDLMIPGVDMVGGFSITNWPRQIEKDRILQLAVKYSSWPPANWMHTKASEGDRVSLKIGGDFHYPNARTLEMGGHDILLIGGGVGINPLASIFFHINDLLQHVDEGADCVGKTHLVYTAKTRDELIFKEEFDRIVESSGKDDLFSADYRVTTGPGAKERVNQDDLEKALNRFDDEKSVACFLCGPPGMVDDMVPMLESLGLPKQNIFYELWW